MRPDRVSSRSGTTLRVTPSYSVLEGEAQLPVVSESGATAAATNQLGGSWSGNSALFFPATAAGDRFTLRLYNDRWEETNFLHEDGGYTNTVSDYDETLSPPDFIVRLKGMMTNWTAAAQSSDDVGLGDQSDVINACGVRVLLRGADMINGDRIECDGRKCRVNFRAAAIEKDRLQIDYAYIMQCKSATEPTPDAEGKTIKQLTFNDGRKSVTVAGGTQGVFTGTIIAGKKVEGEGPWTFMLYEDSTPVDPDGEPPPSRT